jgi:hypothetical protein
MAELRVEDTISGQIFSSARLERASCNVYRFELRVAVGRNTAAFQ